MDSNSQTSLTDRQVINLFESYSKASNSLKDNVKDVYEQIKTEGELKLSTCLTDILMMRKMNRSILLEINNRRQVTDAKRKLVDKTHVELQNILYEIDNLQSEIDSCLKFESRHENMSIISFEELKDLIPTEDLTTDVKKTLKRLDWEHCERIRLNKEVEKYNAEVKELFTKLCEKRSFLDFLGPKLKDIIESTVDLQESIALPFTQANDQYELSFHLPLPLQKIYTLFSHYVADGHFKEKDKLGYLGGLLDKSGIFTCTIEGNLSSAKSFNKCNKKDSNLEQMEVECVDDVEEKIIYHPLHIKLVINDLAKIIHDPTMNNIKFEIDFSWNNVREIVCINCKLDVDNDIFEIEKHPTFGHLVSAENILDYLKISDEEPVSSYIVETNYDDKFYPWAQKLAGLPVPLEKKENDEEKDVYLTPDPSSIKLLISNASQRIRNRIYLTKQLIELEKSTSTYNKNNAKNISLNKITLETTAWESLKIQNILTHDKARLLYKIGALINDDLAFSTSLVIKPNKDLLSVIIIVPVDYPNRNAIILINPWEKEEVSSLRPFSTLRPLIREIEMEVNVKCIDAHCREQMEKNGQFDTPTTPSVAKFPLEFDMLGYQLSKANELIHKLLHEDFKTLPANAQLNVDLYRYPQTHDFVVCSSGTCEMRVFFR